MRAVHLPGVLEGETPPYSFPTKPPPPPSSTTALTRGELTWDEILDPKRFHPHGGAVPGHDVVGTVRKLYPASDVTSKPHFKVGDKVWGLIDFDRDGAAATFAIAHENEISSLPSPPANISASKWELQLTTLPLSALTAYQSIFTHFPLPPSLLDASPPSSTPPPPSILILGPTGSVGLPTLYLALAAHLPTTVLTSGRHLPFLKSNFSPNTDLPFSTVCYDDEGYTDLPTAFKRDHVGPVDLVVDCVGDTTLHSLLLSPELSSVIKPSGKVVTIVAPVSSFPSDLRDRVNANIATHSVSVDFFIVKPDGAQLDILGKLATEGKMVGHVDGVYELERGREAMERVEGKRGVGKVVLTA